MQNIIDTRLKDYTDAHRSLLCQLRDMVHQVGKKTHDCGQIVEALKWNQISFLTEKPKSGTTIRFDKNAQGSISLYVNCNTTIVDHFRNIYEGKFTFIGTREIVLPNDIATVDVELRHIIAHALTYHRHKRTKS